MTPALEDRVHLLELALRKITELFMRHSADIDELETRSYVMEMILVGNDPDKVLASVGLLSPVEEESEQEEVAE